MYYLVYRDLTIWPAFWYLVAGHNGYHPHAKAMEAARNLQAGEVPGRLQLGIYFSQNGSPALLSIQAAKVEIIER